MTERVAQGMVNTGRRPLWIVVASLALAAGALWWSSRLTWEWSRRWTPQHGLVVGTIDGAHDAPALVPLAVLAVAAIAATLAVTGWPRRVLGIVVVLAGMAALWAGTNDLDDLLHARPDNYPLLEALAGHGLAALAGTLIVVAGGFIVQAAGRMPKLGSSYRTPAMAKRVRDPDAELWHALSEGRDPTKDGRPT